MANFILCKSTSVNSYPGVFNFESIDTVENYMQKCMVLGDKYEYKDKTLNYTLNSQGYRAKEFTDVDWSNSVLFFGCSWVFGVGVDDSDTLTDIFTQQTGIDAVNLGMPSVSNWFTVKNCEILHQHNVKPKAVVNFMTYPIRHTIFQDNNTQKHIGKWATDRELAMFELFSEDDTSPNYYSAFCKRLIDSYFECPVLHYSVDPYNAEFLDLPFLIDIVGSDFFWDIKNRARDKKHQGRPVNETIIKYIVNDLNDKIR